MLVFLTIFVALFSIWLVKFVRRRIYLEKVLAPFAGPPRHPIIGMAYYLPADAVGIFRTIMDFHKQYGKNIAFWGLFNDYGLGISEPADVEALLSTTKTINKSREYDFLHDWLGTGLLVSAGRKWHSRRKIITPTFHFKILEQFIDIFNKQTGTMIDKVKPFAKTGEEFDVYKYTTLCALDVICEASMGISINAQDKPNSEYVAAVKEMSMILFKRFFSLAKQYTWVFPLTPTYWEQRKIVKVLHEFTDGVIRQRRDQLLREGAYKRKGEESDKKLNFLDLLLQATSEGKPLSDADIREEVDTFMFEGHDTTTSGIAFTLYHLSKNPKVQQKAYEELVEVLGSKSKTSYLDHRVLQELKYLEMVIKESMRLTPPVPMIGRQLIEEFEIQGVKVPAGTNITVPIFFMNYDPQVFPDPDKFDPERFTLENARDRNAYAYVPFSAGPRNCIGQKFAMLEMKSILSKMLLNYKILPASPDNDLILQADLVLKSTNGVRLRLANRT